ncbi:MAG: helix-hairpin-helix domain-containing protein [Deltaproteobacteria bacterium]|nr:helix-hairpin-helix domain-containing protein [Deltaproteobacteria bacterium]
MRRLSAGWRVAAAALLLTLFVDGAAVAAEEPGRVDLNTASVAELESLPGVGPAKAQAIVAHREAAPFRNADELIEVKGIGEKLYAQLKDRVTIAGAPAARKQGGEPAGAGEARGNRAASAKP